LIRRALLAVLAAWPMASSAETLYVSDRLVIGLRSDITDSATIVRSVETGTALEVLERHGTRARVRGADGIEGWVEERYLSAQPPIRARAAELEGEIKRLRAAAARVPAGDDAAARAFFEAEFAPYAAHGKAGATGKFTGYYVETLHGSRRRHGRFQTPIHGRPADLVSVDLTRFFDDARGRRVWGRLDRGALVPYLTRAEIRAGALARQDLELLWVDDPVDALFAQIEGSAKVILEDGSTVWLEFAGKNGRAYRGVGKLLRGLGELKKGEGTMQGIRAWFARNPHRTDEIIDRNSSYVFFAESERPGALGSQMVTLTARRSLAVDRAFVAFSTPIWVDTEAPRPGVPGARPWRQLLIAQDTGGGILGAVRGDIYWGDDADAADVGGRMGGPGRWWLLLPRSLKVRARAP